MECAIKMILAFFTGGAIGFVVGALVYRNNAVQAEREAAEWREKYRDMVGKVAEKAASVVGKNDRTG